MELERETSSFSAFTYALDTEKNLPYGRLKTPHANTD